MGWYSVDSFIDLDSPALLIVISFPEHNWPELLEASKFVIRAWPCSIAFETDSQKLLWEFLPLPEWYKSMGQYFAKSFTRPVPFDRFLRGHLNNVVQTSEVADAKILLQLAENGRTSVRRVPQIFSARLSIYVSSGRSMSGGGRSTFWSSTATLTAGVISCQWNSSKDTVVL